MWLQKKSSESLKKRGFTLSDDALLQSLKTFEIGLAHFSFDIL
ncbi:hypothetical protein [Shewanella sp. OMA3-2]|nr:hypothetical protein [Shewanella sp. OMA3-2]